MRRLRRLIHIRMQNRITAFIVASLALITALIFVASRRPNAVPSTAGPTPTVAATIFPVADIARNVAGEDVHVALLLPPGASPHTFEPSPSTLRTVTDASAVYAVGHGLDGWIGRLAEDSGTDVVTVDSGIALRRFNPEKMHSAEGNDVHDAADGAVDPHYWLDVRNAKRMARTIAADLASRFPERSDAFARRLSAYELRLEGTDASIRAMLAGASETPMVTLHDAWYYFGDAYGLDIAGTFEPAPGREPTPQYLAALGRAVAESGARVLYTEPQMPTSTLEPFLKDHGLTVAVLDPLGGSDDHASYIDLMLANAATVLGGQR